MFIIVDSTAIMSQHLKSFLPSSRSHHLPLRCVWCDELLTCGDSHVSLKRADIQTGQLIARRQQLRGASQLDSKHVL